MPASGMVVSAPIATSVQPTPLRLSSLSSWASSQVDARAKHRARRRGEAQFRRAKFSGDHGDPCAVQRGARRRQRSRPSATCCRRRAGARSRRSSSMPCSTPRPASWAGGDTKHALLPRPLNSTCHRACRANADPRSGGRTRSGPPGRPGSQHGTVNESRFRTEIRPPRPRCSCIRLACLRNRVPRG